ncbi:MAG: DUF4193 family protein [Actinomycetota bacterium]|nr:DUF4193 family protein [Actinomycetota bacterium]
MADDLDDVTIPDDLDALDDDLEIDETGADELDEDLGDELDEDLGDELDEEDVEEEEGEGGATARAERSTEEAEVEDEDEDEIDEEDVEASLDVILKERLVVVDDEPDDDEEGTDVDDRTETGERVLPKQPDEFVCRSCFLVKHPSQLADKTRMLCRDCV